MLSHVLSSLKAAQQADDIAWVFRYSDSTIEYNALMKIPIHFVIGDTEGHDKLVGKYTCRVNVPYICLLYTSPSPRDRTRSRMPSSA